MVGARNYKIFCERNPAVKDIARLSQGLSEHAYQIRRQAPIQGFAFFIRDYKYEVKYLGGLWQELLKKKSRIKGGCHGCLYYGCVHVDQLWIDAKLRGQGWGTQLMLAVENLAKQEACLFATVCTMDWEARDFYKKLGYVVEFERHGYLKKSVLYFLRKELY